jgi:hypothetical protein
MVGCRPMREEKNIRKYIVAQYNKVIKFFVGESEYEIISILIF